MNQCRRTATLILGLGLTLAGVSPVALAQDKSAEGIATNADGSYVTSTAGVNPTADGGGGTIVYGDINTGPGQTVIGPPSVVQTSPPPAPAPEPVAAAPAEAPASTDTAAAPGDLDADNMADALEWDLGLDPNNADTDGDGVADGDEVNIYFTDPVHWDTDGDGIGDGEELFGVKTDPLVWDEFSAESSETLVQDAAPETQPYQEPSTVAPQGTTETLTATDGDAAALGSGDASAAPGTVTRDGQVPPILGPDGNYRVSETAPANVTIAGDTEVLAPPSNAPTDSGNAPTCGSYPSWYDAQIAYEAAGMTAADPAMVASLDPDYDGIACEEGM